MVMKRFLMLLTSAVWLSLMPLAMAQQIHNLEGFEYGTVSTPDGTEWQSPERLSLNKEQPSAYFFNFKSKEAARGFLPTELGAYYKSLDGMWKFNWVANPSERPINFYEVDYDVSDWDDIPVPSCWNVEGVQKDGTLKYGYPIYVNQRLIFHHEIKVDDWKKGVMREPDPSWNTYKHRNEVGSYRRTFTVPSDWAGERVTINFDGVNSFFYIWLNGKYVGFSKNSKNTATFDLTPYLQKGENTLAVEVYRNSDGSFLENQDMYRLPGIFRSVYLTAHPQCHIRDLIVIPELDDHYVDGKLRIKTELRNQDRKHLRNHKLRFTLYQNELYKQDNQLVAGATIETLVPAVNSGDYAVVESDLYLSHPAQWSAEEPNLYTLVVELLDRRGKVVQTASVVTGFREVEIKETAAEDDEFGLAGRYFYVNGQPVKLKGTNRQEFNPETGSTITAEQMIHEIKLMKRGNINHVRLSHYPNFPIWYYFSDLYGLYLEDEANIESHAYYYGKESLSHVPEFRKSHVARVMEMAAETVNSPSIVIWSLGNEGGPGVNFEHAYKALHEFDPSRPVQYERNNSIVDMGSNQYPSIAWMREAVKGEYKLNYPFHVSEYAHNMGNAGGNLEDYWDAIESTNFFCGAAIWDWVDQALYAYDSVTHERYMAYGGDFGDTPNDGMFCMNGMLFSGHTPKPAYFEVKKVYQDVGIEEIDLEEGLILIFNKRYFKTLDDLKLVVKLQRAGETVETREIPMPSIQPRRKETVQIPFNTLQIADRPEEHHVVIELQLAEDKFWAEAGYVQMEEQLLMKPAEDKLMLSIFSNGKAPLTDLKGATGVAGEGFEVKFDDTTGTILQLTRNGKMLIEPGKGPRIDAFRAPVDNDNWAYQTWFANGLHNLQNKVVSKNVHKNNDGSISFLYVVESQAPQGARVEGGVSGVYKIIEQEDQPFGPTDFKFVTTQVWTVFQDGSIALTANITSNNPSIALPRLGYVLEMASEYDRLRYYGRGPWNNYNDRKAGSNLGLYKSTVAEQFVPFPKPQSMGNREDVRWVEVTDESGDGLLFIAHKQLATSVLPWSALELMLAPHPYQLPESSGTHIHLDLGATGLGGNSCGQGPPLLEDQILSGTHNFGMVIRPAGAEKHIAVPNVQPLSITRDRNGSVVISGSDEAISYQINGAKKSVDYKEPINLREGGTIVAYPKTQPWLQTKLTFPKIESIPATIHRVSSEETNGGSATHLLDADPNTIWHSMYSVTVAGYPHWVELDAGESRELKGFIYTPRQDSSQSGDVREYSIQVSSDGKDWSEPIVKGGFERNKSSKRVLFDHPIKARYLRFNALSSQNGQDYAAASELLIIAD